ncbi:MAG TPA: 4-(cytidine 5'-diphospho)-2-C-methyl-D-erythritol kinase [Casimicrobiaceae bacterium]|nr:4-(cytidine 5'-diphospho)-2-C-methyl-D-erythritol kinase [Casimicrobiaceae bacterium]
MQTLTLAAPAKINLFLHVTGRRADGYHTLESLLVLVDLADSVELTVRDDGAILRSAPLAGVPERDDLTLRAAHALRDAAQAMRGVAIRVVKRIPQGAGLGGGSSDAATVLLGLNRLWSLQLSRAELMRIGARLGADVPFFLGEGAALARGTGDVLASMSVPACWIALAMPRVHVATASIFASPELTRSAPSAKMDVFSEGYGHNDLEPAAVARFPQVREAVQALRRASPASRMTGSGACVFAVFASEDDARRALASLPPDVPGCIVRTLNRHPLASFAA